MAKREKSFPEKMKNFFRRAESITYNFDGMQIEPYVVTLDVLKDISNENSTSHRLKALKELHDNVLTKKLVEHAVEAICVRIEDLITPQHPTEVRHEVFQFFCALILGQNEYLHIMRTYLFRMIILHNIQEDIAPRFVMLKALTNDGKNINYFEEEIGPFLLYRFVQFMVPDLSTDFLKLLTNLIKFNAAYLDDNIIEGFIDHVLKMCCQTSPLEDIQEGLNILEAVLCYSHLPRTVLKSFITILCITANVESLVECSWKQMRNLLGTNLGIPGIYVLCEILQTRQDRLSVVRAAVYFIGMALWDSNRVPTLNIPPNAVLPSFIKVLETKSFVIAREVLLALNRLVVECSGLLEYMSVFWDTVFEIVETIQGYPEFQNFSLPMDTCVKELNDFITVAEEKCASDSYESLSKIIDNYSILRSEQSIIRLVLHKAKSITSYKPNLLLKLNKLLEKFFKNEKRSLVQLEVLKVLHEIRLLNLRILDDDVLDQVILQNFMNSDGISDVAVRKATVDFLIMMAESITSSLFLDVLDILERIIKRMLETAKIHGDATKESHADAIVAVEGLIYVFKRKLFLMPSIHCVEVFTLLVKHMQQQYSTPSYTDDAMRVRKLILEFFFEIRANNYKQVGVLTGSGTGHSVYLMCDSSPSREPGESVPSSPLPASPSAVIPSISYLSFDRGFQVFISSLKEERDWRILEKVLKEIPILLQNKSLILRSNCGVATLCSTICQMIHERSNGVYESLRNAPARFNRTEFHGYIFPCAVAFTSYHSNMESHIQRLLIRSLQFGLVSRSAKICIEGLTLCMLEMQNSMNKLLPDVLLKLSKISATKMVAVPVLEFLSNLIRLPHLYITFVEDQYMSIFAIALPYTNPFKFNQYTVALAHHVLSMWFLKCRIPFRRDFAKFITKGLRSNIKHPRTDKSTSSQSLDQGSAKAFRDEKSSASQAQGSRNQNSPREDSLTEEERAELAILELHTELMETGLDLMTRFTFGMCTNLPQRSPVAEFLLEKGQKSSWLVGNKIITITTSGCGTKTFKHGLCELCYTSSHGMDKTEESDSESTFMEPETTDDSKPKEFLLQRKRHRSAVQRRNTTLSEEIATSANKTKDDIMLHYPRTQDKMSRRHTSYLPDTDRFTTTSANETDKDKQDRGGHLCSCWCTSWAEVHIRRPTGNTSWMMKIQNRLFLPSAPLDVPLSVLNSLVLPRVEKELEPTTESPSEGDAVSLLESEMKELSCEGAIEIASNQKSTPPMRRTNSSPDMNTGWFSSLESKQSSLEGSLELEKDESKSQQPATSTQPSSMKQRVPEKTKSKNLKLDFAPFSKGKSSSTESAPRFERDSVGSAPVGKRQHSEVSAHPQPSTPGSFRDRGHTISVMSPNRPTGADTATKTSEVNPRNGMSPSFVFLQLFQDGMFGITSPKPLLIPHCETNNRALTVLDHIPPYDTHKIGVVYIGPGQVDNEVAILSNEGGSSRYVEFLRGMGRLTKLKDIDPHTTYLGGLDTRGEDGDYALIWHDDVMQVVFHEATFMRNKESDKMRNEKKKHIANDYVMIAYNEGGADFNIATIRGHVTNACIVVKPEDFNCNVVTVSHKTAEMKESFGHTESYIVSDESLSVFVRQMALHANLASMLISRRIQGNKYTQVSNWLERLRAIKRLRSKLQEEFKTKNAESYAFEAEPADYTDFTDYV